MGLTLVVAGDGGDAATSLIEALGRPLGAAVLDLEGHPDPAAAMLAAGPLGIDAYLLVVAADVGITPETHELAALLRALGVDAGLAVVTRAELADSTGVPQIIGELVPGRPAHAVSVASRAGLDALRAAIDDLLATLPARAPEPAAAYAGGGAPAQTRVIDAALDFGRDREREPEHGAQAVVHLRGAASPGRLARLGGRFWQIRLERPIVAAAGDRLVVRQPAGDDAVPGGYTLGGGVVLDPAARRHPTSNESIVRLTRIWRGLPPLPPEPPRGS
jgi:hypothetical protein